MQPLASSFSLCQRPLWRFFSFKISRLRNGFRWCGFGSPTTLLYVDGLNFYMYCGDWCCLMMVGQWVATHYMLKSEGTKEEGFHPRQMNGLKT